MSIWIALVGGIILGWLIEWLVDWLYWRRGIEGFYATENELRGELQNIQREHTETTEQMTALRGQFDAMSTSKQTADRQLQDVTAAKTSLDQQLQETTAAKASLDQQLQETTAAKTSVDQQLQEVSAAKAAIEQQLQETTAAKVAIEQQLQEATAATESVGQQLQEVTTANGSAEQQLQEITAAKLSVEQQLQEMSAAKAAIEQQLQEATTSKVSVEQQLQETTVAKDAAEQKFQEALTEKATVDQQLQDALATLEAARQPRRDDLEQIDGIGPVYEQRLFDAGINTFAQLAITPLDRLKAIIQPASWQHTNLDSWAEHARKFAEVVIFDLLPYRLEEINGIGPAYAKRLNAQGIMTFNDLAQTPEERLREIIPQRGGLAHDFAKWIREARAFVGLTTGDRPPLPLERIKGIGPVFATRLDLAGIHSFADLAAANEEQLRDIIGTSFLQIANFSRWIEQAKTFAIGEAQPQTQSNGEAQEDKGQPEGNRQSSNENQVEITSADNGSVGA